MPLIKYIREFEQIKHLSETMTLEQLEEDFSTLEQTYLDLWFAALKQVEIKLRYADGTKWALLLNSQEFNCMFEDLKTDILKLMIIENYSFVAARRSVLGIIFSAHENYIYGITFHNTTPNISEDMNEVWITKYREYFTKDVIREEDSGFYSQRLKLGVVELRKIINQDQNIYAMSLCFWHSGEYTQSVLNLGFTPFQNLHS